MFASTADGVKDCVPGEYNELKMNLLDYIKLLKNYFKAAYPDYDLVLAGEAENLSQELETCCSISIQHEGFRHISKPEFMQRFPSEIQNAMTIVNNHSKNPSLSFNRQNNSCPGAAWLGLHALSLVKPDVAEQLQICNFGNTIWNTLQVYAIDITETLWSLYGNETNEDSSLPGKGWWCAVHQIDNDTFFKNWSWDSTRSFSTIGPWTIPLPSSPQKNSNGDPGNGYYPIFPCDNPAIGILVDASEVGSCIYPRNANTDARFGGPCCGCNLATAGDGDQDPNGNWTHNDCTNTSTSGDLVTEIDEVYEDQFKGCNDSNNSGPCYFYSTPVDFSGGPSTQLYADLIDFQMKTIYDYPKYGGIDGQTKLWNELVVPTVNPAKVLAILVWDNSDVENEVIKAAYPFTDESTINVFKNVAFPPEDGIDPPPVVSVKIKYLIDNNVADGSYTKNNPFTLTNY